VLRLCVPVLLAVAVATAMASAPADAKGAAIKKDRTHASLVMRRSPSNLPGPADLATPPAWTAYVANGNADDVTPVDTATNTVGTTIALPSGTASPAGIAITPDGKTAYVVNAFSNNVTPIDVATNTAGSTIAWVHLPAPSPSPLTVRRPTS
jgi:YVTN family beta-propeller protein